MAKSKTAQPKLKSKDIVDLLALKHHDAVFVPECKDGPTQRGSHQRMDAWVMIKSWANPLTIGYEVKVSRSDFLNDDKWHAYLAYCNELYFVCPHGLIQPDELPPEVGLIWVTKTGGRLVTKKKAQRREVVVPENIYRYILMWRTQVTGEVVKDKQRDVPWWHQEIERKGKLTSIGHSVGKRLGDKLRSAEQRIHRLRRSLKLYRHVRRRIKELGFDVTKSVSTWDCQNELKRLNGQMTVSDQRSIREAAKAMGNMVKLMDGAVVGAD